MKALGLFTLAVFFGLQVMGLSSVPDDASRSKLAQGGAKIEDLVKIEFAKKEFTFTTAEAAREVKFEYRIIVEKDIPGVIALAAGPSFNTPPGPAGLFPVEKVAGNGQFYCLLDFGLAPPPKEVAKTIKKGDYKHSFTWDGRNWNGPSDFNNPKGKPFPPGMYMVTVTLSGKLTTDQGAKPYQISESAKLILK
jgi:hypothetical protein